MDCGCRSVFNRLSRLDRFKLKTSAMTETVTGFIRDDSKEHPARFPFYAIYFALVATPLPLPFLSVSVLAATVLWAKCSQSGYAAKLNKRLSDAFNEKNLLCRNRAFLEPDWSRPGSHKVKGLALAGKTARESFGHSREAARHAWNAFKRLIAR